MKKISKIVLSIVLCLSLVFYFPVSSKASGITLQCKTITSVDGYYSDPDYNRLQKRLTSYNPTLLSNYGLDAIYNALSSYTPSSSGNFDRFFIILRENADMLVIEEFNSDVVDSGLFLCAENNVLPGVNENLNNLSVNTHMFYNRVLPGEYLRECVYNFTTQQWSYSFSTSTPGFSEYRISDFLYLDGNIPMYCKWDVAEKGGNYSEDITFYLSDKSAYTDFLSRDLPYETEDGSIVDPSPDVVYEGNNNHMYFKDCEIGFCYPKSSPSPVSFGGAYFYIKYTVDDWIVNHISDYNLVFYADAEVGSEVTNTIRYEIALDPDGCITIPFSRIWTSPLTSKGFSVLVTDREIEDNFYKAYLYSLSPSGFIDFGNKAAASNQNSISGALSALSSGGIQSFLYYINGDQIDFYSALSDVATSIATKYNPYLITAFTLLTDDTDNSGLFEMEFDLVAGTEDVTDTGGLVNPDPFIPQDQDDPGFVPPAPTPGNSTIPGYNIVPSGFWQGTMNAVIGYDPGYRELKSDVNRDPNGNFSQYLDPMHNDDVGSWFMSFVNEMPTEMKSILIAGVGVGVLFGLYRFIRRG